MDSGNYDWTAFATGFGVALLLIFVIRWRRTQRRTNSLSAPPRSMPSINDLSPDLRAQILLLKAEGQKIEAIKLTRERTGLDLKSSKELVERVR
jgi:Ribosomal protein L7/L12 C-terminal domain